VAELAQLHADSGGVLAATKVHIPAVRPEHVPRPGLVDALVDRQGRILTVIEAPAGYGKTTLLSKWAASPEEDADFAWLSLDEGDNDPARFWSGVIDALRTIEPGFGERSLAAVGARNIGLVDVALPLLLNELAGLDSRIVLVLDDYQLIREQEVRASLGFLIERLPPRLHLALGTRTEPPLPLARLRAGNQLLEIRTDRLRFAEEQAGEFLERALGLRLDAAALRRLMERTEGWPAGLYLAGLSLRDRDDPQSFIESFAGDDRHIVDYLSSEVLADQPEELRDFLLRSSVLDSLSGPLCDAVMEADDSAARLRQLEERNLFLIPLDNTRTWYRYHRLFRELLRHELELASPGASVELNRRASEWFEAEGLASDAIAHALAAGDADRARDLVAASWNDYFNRGRLGTVDAWLAKLSRREVRADPRLCVAGAWLALDRGQLVEAGSWIESASAAADEQREPVDRLFQADVGVLGAVHGFKTGSLADAMASALAVLPLTEGEEESFPRMVAELILGVTLYWIGEVDRADARLTAAAELCEQGGNDLGQAYALGYLGLIAADAGDAERAERQGKAATGLRDAPEFSEHFVLMVGHLATSAAAEAEGDLARSETEARRALELARRGGGRLELGAALLQLAGTLHLRGAAADARRLLAEAREVIQACSDAGTMAGRLATAERALRAPGSRSERGGEAAEELTDRELGVLRLLATDLSRREIANALYVTQNTVKTHLKGIYRKLDATSREGAVARARELGLI
jgi:LuxR family transcriptional regulator, maltose regulon positive regulatory protein